MARSADFKDAHCRHWADAETLFRNSRWANADHLYGFSVECGLKAVMAKLGMQLDSFGSPKEFKYRTHVNSLWPKFQVFAQGRGGSWFVTNLPKGEPFANWTEHDRYAHQQYITESETVAHRDAANKVLNILKNARMMGLL